MATRRDFRLLYGNATTPTAPKPEPTSTSEMDEHQRMLHAFLFPRGDDVRPIRSAFGSGSPGRKPERQGPQQLHVSVGAPSPDRTADLALLRARDEITQPARHEAAIRRAAQRYRPPFEGIGGGRW